MKSGELSQADYSITYVVDPKKTYLIQPKEGELNYDNALKNPSKFYDRVMNQDVMEHRVAKKTRTNVVQGGGQPGEMPAVKRKTRGFEMTSRLTKRAIARILVAVQNKLHTMINDATQHENLDPALVREALEHPET